MQTDFLIIGQGLAGSLLGWELIQRGRRVIVIDNGKENASLVSAGLVNPITGLRFVKTPDIEELLPTACDYYRQLSAFFGQEFFIKKPMIRIFRDQVELDHCTLRQTQSAYTPYLGNLTLESQKVAPFSAPFGFIEQKQTGYLLTTKLLSCLKQYFIARNSYRQGVFDYPALQLSSSVLWKSIRANQVIFCEGHLASQNPWLSWLPLQPAKGEILTLSCQSAIPDAILNYGNWLIPTAPSKVRIGATFDREHLDIRPSKQGKETLLGALMTFNPSLAASPVVSHQAGIRPCTADKQPFIGKHPLNNQIAIFNGFGAKGSLHIPCYAGRFADYLLDHRPLPVSCDIQRYHAIHFPG